MAPRRGYQTPWARALEYGLAALHACVALRSLFLGGSIVRIRLLALSFVLPFSTLAQTSSAQSKSEVVCYHATIDNVKYVFGVAPPVARLKPGNILDANSLDCFGNPLPKPADSFSLVKGDNPLTGPFHI